MLGEGREVAHVQEHDRHVDLLAVELDILLEDSLGDVGVHVASERGPDPLALGQAGGHPVEAQLQPSHLSGVVDGDAHIEAAGLDLLHGVTDRVDGVGGGPRREHHREQADEHRDQAQRDHHPPARGRPACAGSARRRDTRTRRW